MSQSAITQSTSTIAAVSPTTTTTTAMESNPSNPTNHPQDFLTHLESYLSKRDGVDKLLKITRYTTKIILSTTPHHHHRLKTFESNIGLSRKAFRIGKFIQDINSFRSANLNSVHSINLAILAYGGEGLYYFVEQLVWVIKSGLVDGKQLGNLQKVGAWAELIGYVGSIGLKVRDLKGILEDEMCLVKRVESGDEELEKLREKKLLKKLGLVQDVADGLMAVADVRNGKGRLSGPVLLASAGLLLAVISAHKNWLSC
ncbi:putative peroxisomal biogenesis factor 11 [Helianthus annuus]|nr:putative peroxisomal biogenesis factor 11 [Helianthus annuus]